jgi:hypothetical protein
VLAEGIGDQSAEIRPAVGAAHAQRLARRVGPRRIEQLYLDRGVLTDRKRVPSVIDQRS